MLGLLWKHRRSALLLLAVWIIFECWISWGAFCNQTQNYGGNYQPAEENNCVFRGPVASLTRFIVRWWQHTFDHPDAYVALFTAVLAVSTIYLWDATRAAAKGGDRAANIAEQALLKLQRAFVYNETLQANNIRDPKTNTTVAWRFFVKWHNSGNTEARKVLLHASWENFPDDIPADFDFPNRGEVQSAPIYIAAKSHTLSAPMDMDVSVIYGVMQGHFRLFF
jgi:hypothetical protein